MKDIEDVRTTSGQTVSNSANADAAGNSGEEGVATQWSDFVAREKVKAGDRVKAAVKNLQAKGIIDDTGRLRDSTTPPDMIPDSKNTLG